MLIFELEARKSPGPLMQVLLRVVVVDHRVVGHFSIEVVDNEVDVADEVEEDD